MNQAPPPDPVEQHVFGRLILFLLLAVAIVVVLQLTVKTEPVGEPVETTTAPSETTEAPATQPVATQPVEGRPSADSFKAEVSIEDLDDQQVGWLTILGQTRSDQTSSVSGQYRRDNEFTIKTTNVDRFVIELDRMPVLNNKRFILHIDEQDMVLRPPQSGIVAFARSPEGRWSKED